MALDNFPVVLILYSNRVTEMRLETLLYIKKQQVAAG